MVGADLDRLEQQQVLEKVSHSDWATPLWLSGSHVVKLDDVVTSKLPLIQPCYVFPLPGGLFQKLNGGHKFSKLDPRRRHHQN